MYCIFGTNMLNINHINTNRKLQQWMKITIQIVPEAVGADSGALLSGTSGNLDWLVDGICSIPLGGGALCTSGTVGCLVCGVCNMSLGGVATWTCIIVQIQWHINISLK